MRKVVLKLALHDDRTKTKAMRIVSGLPGVDSVSVDMKEEKLTVVGNVDTVTLANKLRKLCPADVVSVGPAKEEKGGDKKPDENKEPKNEMSASLKAYYDAQMKAHHQALMMRAEHDALMMNSPYFARSMEEDPNSCTIC